MSYRVHCDWCGEYLAPEDDQAVMPVTVQHHRGNGTLDAKWAEETKPTRHFCASPREERDRDGRNRMGLMADDSAGDSCYDRALAAIRGTESTTPDMGMEWRLMPADPDLQPAVAEAEAKVTQKFDERRLRLAYELADADLGLTPRATQALLKAGIGLERAKTMSDDELLALSGVGQQTVERLRAAIERDSQTPEAS